VITDASGILPQMSVPCSARPVHDVCRMARAFITGWARDTWQAAEANGETGTSLRYAASDQFGWGGNVEIGDRLYVLGNDDGRLIVISRLTVDEKLDRAAAARRLPPDVWEAEWHVIGRDGLPLRFDRIVPEADARAIVSERGTPLRIAPDEYRLDNQTLMRTRAITPESAAMLDRVLAAGTSTAGEVIATAALARRLNSAERKAVEERAMTVAAHELRRAGWDRIVRTAEDKSWDYEVTREGNGTARVEVKGSTLPIRAIELTRKERDSAVAFGHSILVLVGEIELDRSAPTSATGGNPRLIDPWRPSADDFIAQRYSYQVPPDP
jgi:hypothetical protein